ncbi:hypothetical protein chiPu_0030849, partial [Chiloscyllium punctatum]|nr:hypothetical protein [Chiloscyllium punctatum]
RVVLRAARLLRPDHVARRPAAGQGIPDHQIRVLHHPDFARGHPRLPGLGVARRVLGPEGDAGNEPALRRDRLPLLRLGGGPDPARHRGPLHAVLPVRHVVGALRLYARTVSDPCPGNRDRIRLRGRPNRIADRPVCDRRDPARGGTERRVRARRRRVRGGSAGGAAARRGNPRPDAGEHFALMMRGRSLHAAGFGAVPIGRPCQCDRGV